jgi:pimeloyl-ACP methyl ester carboxylesterase
LPHIRVCDLELYYERIGVGEPILFLHSSYSRGILAFSCQIGEFQHKYLCFLPDFRGHGRTRCASLQWSTPQLADDTIGFMDALNIEKAHIIGYSLGANVALYCAVNSPVRVASLVTIGCSGFADASGADDYEPEQLIQNGQQDIIDHMMANHEEAHRGNWQEFMRQSARDWRLYPQLTEGQLSGICAPALFIAGENDPFGTKAQLERLSSLVQNARYLVVPGCGHGAHMLSGNAPYVNSEILRFLGEHPCVSHGTLLGTR